VCSSDLKLSIFIFHRVLPVADPLMPYEPSAEQFDWMARLLARNFNVLPLGEACRRLNEGTLPAAAAAITFDDGYADNEQLAWPILKRHGLPATFFIATGFLDGGRMWNDEIIEAVRTLPEGKLDLAHYALGTHHLSDIASRIKCYTTILSRLKYFEHALRGQVAREIGQQCGVPRSSSLMMTRDQLRALHAAGAEIGAHTQTHPILELMNDELARQEIEMGKHELEEIIGETVSLFAYPNGVPGQDCSGRHGEMSEQLGFTAAVTTAPRSARGNDNIYHLPRFTPWDRTPLRFALRCLLQLRSV
jgi:peptidoglycan/xylan/chitin deacetylase (PgdA/CDA1 family)